jgi:U-box domain
MSAHPTVATVAAAAAAAATSTASPSVAPFGRADMEKLEPIALVARFLSIKDHQLLVDTADVISRRMTTENFVIADKLRREVVDRIMKIVPHFAVRPMNEISSLVVPQLLYLVVLIDTSGSMGGCIIQIQAVLKAWTSRQLNSGKYSGVSFIFFDNYSYGPFTDISCLDRVHGHGGTCAGQALESTRRELIARGHSDVIFMTDGHFHDSATAYNIQQLPNVAKFSMIFPSHTPSGAEGTHFAHLPRITPPNTPVFARRSSTNDEVASICSATCDVASFAPIKETLYKLICGEYVILKDMTLYQMGSITNKLLEYEDVACVHHFFSHIMGMYNLMMTRSGDLLNTLRSDEMKLLWQFMQPLKKRFKEVPESSIHHATAQCVLTFLESYEADVCDRRDKRLAELRRSGQTDEVVREIREIRQAFENMKKVDEYDRIMDATDQLAKKCPCVTVKFNYVAQVAVDAFRGYPNLDPGQIDEIYKMIASIGICDRTDPDAIKLPLDSYCKGLMLVLQQLTFRKSDEVRMTLSATHVFRIISGFFVSQLSVSEPYKFTQDHIRIRNMITQLVSQKYSHAIMFNLTNMREQSNTAPAWIRILHGLSSIQIRGRSAIFVPDTKPPADVTVWQKVEGGYVLNHDLLTRMVDRSTALSLFRFVAGLGSTELSARVTTRYPFSVNFKNAILVKVERGVTMEEWRDMVVGSHRIRLPDGDVHISITNGMYLQEHICQDVTQFLAKYWESGHRLINKSGAAHPATTIGTNIYERSAFDLWIRSAWPEYVQLKSLPTRSVYPIVPSSAQRDELDQWLTQRTSTHPLFYTRDSSHNIPIAGVVHKIGTPVSCTTTNTAAAAVAAAAATGSDSSARDFFTAPVLSLAHQMSLIEGFSRMSGDEQVSRIDTLVPTGDTFTHTLAPEVEAKIDLIVTKIHERFTRRPTVTGEGKTFAMKIKTVQEIEDLGQALATAENPFAGFDPDDFIDPITYEMIESPVSFGGHVYDRTAIETWLETDFRRSSPLTRQTHNPDGTPLQILAAPQRFVDALAYFRQQQSSNDDS